MAYLDFYFRILITWCYCLDLPRITIYQSAGLQWFCYHEILVFGVLNCLVN